MRKIFSTILALSIVACFSSLPAWAQGLAAYGGPGMGWGTSMMWGGGWFGGIFMILFWILLIVGIIALVRWIIASNRTSGTGVPSTAVSALEILKQRYAKGEIDRDQFIAMKRDLEG